MPAPAPVATTATDKADQDAGDTAYTVMLEGVGKPARSGQPAPEAPEETAPSEFTQAVAATEMAMSGSPAEARISTDRFLVTSTNQFVRFLPQCLGAFRIKGIREDTGSECAYIGIFQYLADTAIFTVASAYRVGVRYDAGPHRRGRPLRDRLQYEWRIAQGDVLLVHGHESRLEVRGIEVSDEVGLNNPRMGTLAARTPRALCRASNATASKASAVLERPFGGEMRFVAVASSAYLAGREAPRTPDDLRDHACIRIRLPSGKPYRWEFMLHGQVLSVDVPGALTLDHTELMIGAAADGLGIAYVPQRSALPWIERGALALVLDEWCPWIPGLFLYYSSHRYVPLGFRAFIDVLKAV